MTDRVYARLRVVHLVVSCILALIATVHAGMTWLFYRTWSPDAVWFLGTGLGLLLLAVLNLSHIGIEPCRRSTARLVRAANWIFAAFGCAAVIAVPEPQAFVAGTMLVVQAIVSGWTLPGPG